MDFWGHEVDSLAVGHLHRRGHAVEVGPFEAPLGAGPDHRRLASAHARRR